MTLCMAGVLVLCTTGAEPGPGAIRSRLAGVFVDAKTGVLYTRVRRGSMLEDCTLYGGFYLGALATAWEVEPTEATGALARRVLTGLLLNTSMGEPGFVARGVAPDRRRFAGQPSADQITGLLYGLYAFHGSAMATAEEKATVAKLFADVLTRLKRDRYRILTADRSAVTTFGRLDAIRPTRSERLLSFLLAGAHVTGDRQWRAEYEKAREPRMKSLAGFDRFDSWVLLQTAASLRMLCDLERRPEVVAVYKRACREVAQRCLGQISPYKRFVDDPRPASVKQADRAFRLATVRIPIEAVATVLLVGDTAQVRQAAGPLKAMLATLPADAFENSVPLVSLEWAWWLARRRGGVLTGRP